MMNWVFKLSDYSESISTTNKKAKHIMMSWPLNAFISDNLSRIQSFFLV